MIKIPFDCNSTAVQSAVMQRHEITEDVFNEIVNNAKPYGTIPSYDIEAKVQNATGCENYVEVTCSDDNGITSVIFQVMSIPASSEGPALYSFMSKLEELIRYFSFALFKGFYNSEIPFRPFAPQTFDFFLVTLTDADNTPLWDTVVFRINGPANTATYWDLSGSIPPTK